MLITQMTCDVKGGSRVVPDLSIEEAADGRCAILFAEHNDLSFKLDSRPSQTGPFSSR